MADAMRSAVSRLLDCLRSEIDSSALVREVIDRALLGAHGKALAAVTAQDTQHARIATVLAHVHAHYMQPFSVEELCGVAGMRASTFHQAFKAVTGNTPLQFQKKVRLENARFLIAREGYNVTTAASQVGYESLSQSSREFNVPPRSRDGSARHVYLWKGLRRWFNQKRRA